MTEAETDLPYYSACEEGPGLCSFLITIASVLIILGTLPLSLLFTVKVVQEYERAVIFRLGRLLTGGARGPGVFFIIPCVDIYEKIDMRTKTYEIPPQEVRLTKYYKLLSVNNNQCSDTDQGLGDGVCQCHHVLQGEGRHLRRGQRGRLQRVRTAAGSHHSQVS